MQAKMARDERGHWIKGTSGNPKGRVANEESLTYTLRKMAGERAEEIALAVLDLALGHQVQEIDKDGEERIYTRSPDARAQAMLYDRADGRVPNRTEITGGTDDDGNEKPIPLRLLPPE